MLPSVATATELALSLPVTAAGLEEGDNYRNLKEENSFDVLIIEREKYCRDLSTKGDSHSGPKVMAILRRISEFAKKLWTFVKSISLATWIRLGILALFVGSLFLAIGLLQKFGLLEKIFKWIDSIGYVGLLMIVGMFQLATLPVSSLYSLICISSGFLYGIWIGSATCLGSAGLSATTGFFASRYLCRGWVESKIRTRPLFQNIDDIIAKEGFKLLFFIRFVPIPFGWTNSFMAATKMRYHVYISASVLGLAPELVALVYVGTTIKTLSQAFTGEGPKGLTTTQIILLCVEIVAAIVCLIICTLIGRKALIRIRAMKNSQLEEISPSEEESATTTIATETTEDSIPNNDNNIPLSQHPQQGFGGNRGARNSKKIIPQDDVNIALYPQFDSNSSSSSYTTHQSSSTTTAGSSSTFEMSESISQATSNSSNRSGTSSFPRLEVVMENEHWVFETGSEAPSRRESSATSPGDYPPPP